MLFQRLDFDVACGRWLHVVGANGAGKTSLLRMLCGLTPLESGDILWRTRSVARYRSAFLSDLCFLGHHNALQESLTVWDNLAFSAALSGGAMSAVRAADLLAQFGVQGLGKQVVRQLSQGQKKRVALARLALSPARLWVLDEPFVGMDDRGVRMLTDLIAAHLAQSGVVVLTSHQALSVAGAPPLVLELGA